MTRRTPMIVGALLLASILTGPTPAAADPVTVDVTCDLPSPAGVGGIYGSAVPDTIAEHVPFEVVGRRVVAGYPTHESIDLSIPVIVNGLPRPLYGDFTPTYGYLYVTSIDLTVPIPDGLDLASVTATVSPPAAWVGVTKVGTDLVVHVQSPVHGSLIRMNADVNPITSEVETSAGVWASLAGTIRLSVEGRARSTGASSIDWHPPALTLPVTYNNSAYSPFLSIAWAAAPTTCTPDAPSQVVAHHQIIPGHGFTDLHPPTFYDEAVSWAKADGLVSGFANNTFRGGTSVNRGQIVNMLWTLMDAPTGSTHHAFADVPARAFYLHALDWARAHSLVTGFRHNTFHPLAAVDRGQLVNMIWHMVGAPTGSPPGGFTDVASTAFYRPGADWAKAHHLLEGFVHGGRLTATASVTRGQVADTLFRLAGDPTAWTTLGTPPSTVVF